VCGAALAGSSGEPFAAVVVAAEGAATMGAEKEVTDTLEAFTPLACRAAVILAVNVEGVSLAMLAAAAAAAVAATSAPELPPPPPVLLGGMVMT